MSFNKKILSFLDEAFTKQIIDETIKIKLQNFADKYDNKSSLSFLNIIGFCGAIAIISGLILLISHNWNKIANIIKFASYITLITSLYIAGYFFRNKNQKISQIIYFIISVLMIAGIGLMSQIFDLSSKNGEAFLIWFLLTLPMAIILKNSWIATISACGFYLWVIINVGINNIDNEIIFLTIIFSNGILLPLTFKKLNELFYQIKLFSFALLGIIIFIFGIKAEILQYRRYDIDLNLTIIIILISNLICLAINFINNYRNKINILKILQQPESIIFTIIFAQFLQIDYKIFYWIIWFWGCFSMIYEGEISKNRGLINAGIWFFTLGIITRFIDLIKSMLFTGLMFILFGILLIAIAITAEKIRRKFINNIFNNHE